MIHREPPPGTRKRPIEPLDDDSTDVPLPGLGWGEILVLTGGAILLIIATIMSHG